MRTGTARLLASVLPPALVCAATVAPRANAEFAFSGAEFVVNGVTVGSQREASLAPTPDGGFVAVWSSASSTCGGTFAPFLSGRLLDAELQPEGPDFVIDGGCASSTTPSKVAVESDGSFLVVWVGSDLSDTGVIAQHYSPSGVATGPAAIVNSYTTGFQRGPSIAVDGDDEFIVAWRSELQDGSGAAVVARRLDSAGAPTGTEFVVNTYTTSDQSGPRIATMATGGFMVTWRDGLQEGTFNGGVYAQLFDATDAPVGGEFRVPATTAPDQSEADVARLGNDDLVVVWQQSSSGGSTDIMAKRHDPTGTPLGTEFTVNDYTTGERRFPGVWPLSDGSFVVTWLNSHGPVVGPLNAISQARHFDADGTPLGGDFAVSTYLIDALHIPITAAPLPDGGLVVAGTGGESGEDGVVATFDGDREAVVARTFCLDGTGADADLDGAPDRCDACPGFDDALDDDGDGRPNGCDDCTNPSGAHDIDIKPRLSVDQDKRRAKLRGEVVIGTPFSAVDPIASGAHLVITPNGGLPRSEIIASPGAYDGTSGWRTNGKQSVYKYRSKLTVGFDKVTQTLVIKDRSNVAPGQVRVSAKHSGTSIRFDEADQELLQARITFGDPALGQCGETAFGIGDCAIKGTFSPDTRISCKQ